MTVNLVIIVGATEPLFDLNHLYFPTDASLKLIIFLGFFEINSVSHGLDIRTHLPQKGLDVNHSKKHKNPLAPFFSS